MKYYFFNTAFHLILVSVLLFFISCAPRVAAPPQYLLKELSLDEIIMKASDDIQTLKAVADITIEKNLQTIDHINASLLIQGAGRIHIRVYKFGMLVNDLIMVDGILFDAKGKSNSKFTGLISEFARAVFWWDNMNNGSLRRDGDVYIIQSGQKEIRLDAATLLPVKQDIITSGKSIAVVYAEPRDYDGFWQPSELTISIDDLRFRIKIDKLLKNPPAGESDFRIPSGG
ncbi:MAG: hypothetical protein C4538_02155 [Nitrospiraceae bacterium]|nr:MAG: hypothetical protein C4538_02155 [Nitrospiraceae bacterium]